MTALLYAAFKGKCDIVNELIRRGADTKVQDKVNRDF